MSLAPVPRTGSSIRTNSTVRFADDLPMQPTLTKLSLCVIMLQPFTHFAKKNG